MYRPRLKFSADQRESVLQDVMIALQCDFGLEFLREPMIMKSLGCGSDPVASAMEAVDAVA